MKKNIIVSLLFSIVCVLTSCTAEPTTQPPTIKPTSTISVQPIQTNKTAAEYSKGMYIGNKNSKKLHRPDCWTLPAEENRIEFSSRAEAINAGYSPCGNCLP